MIDCVHNAHLTQQQRHRWMALLLETADDLKLPDDPEFRSALVGYLEWGSRLAVLNSSTTENPVDSSAALEFKHPMKLPRIASIHAGKIAPLGPDGVPSGFVKHLIDQSVQITPLGIEGDEQADLSVHGGTEKAVYGYALENYDSWRAEYPHHAATLMPGGFGENLCIEGMREADLCVGDIHRIGSAQLQVCQPRQPCFKLALRFEDKMMPKALIRSGRAGWYYRVLEPGEIAPGAAVSLEGRPNSDFSFARLVDLISHGNATRQELERMQRMEGLAFHWKAWAQDRLAR